jgi:hypothetical protein
LAATVVALVLALVLKSRHLWLETSVIGAVLTEDPDPSKQAPIPNVEIVASDASGLAESRSDASGSFRLILNTGIRYGSLVTLKFRHPDYDPLDISGEFGDRICVARMVPRAGGQRAEASGPETLVTNVRIRYAMTNLTAVNIGSMAKPFEILNKGDIPCEHRLPCSPDGKWKAAKGLKSFDAGEGNEFSDVRISCIAGPCPFTRIESSRLSGGRLVGVSVLNWSDTATFLFEAEVTHTMPTDAIRQSYPTTFGRNMSFTLPAMAQGLSLEAEMNGTDIVFPIGPDLRLNWARCNMRTVPEEAEQYTCELRPGYRFK